MFALTMRGMQKSLIIGLLGALIVHGAGRGRRRVRRLLRRRAEHRAADADRSAAGAARRFSSSRSCRRRSADRPGSIFVLLLAAFQWMITARIVRGMTLSLQGARVRAGGPLHGRAGLADHLPPHPAEHVVAAHHRRDGQRELADPGRGRPVVLRLRRAAAGRVARHAHRRLRRRGADLSRGSSTSRPASSSCWCWRSTWSATACATPSTRTRTGAVRRRDAPLPCTRRRCSRSRTCR